MTKKKQTQNRNEPSLNTKLYKKEINWKTFEYLCSIQCSQIEIAGALLVEPDTLRSRVAEYYGSTYSVVNAQFAANGHAGLRRSQWEKAVKHLDSTMLKFLGVQYLGQHEKTKMDVEHSGAIQTSSIGMDDVKRIHGDPLAKKLSLELAERMLELEQKEIEDGKNPQENPQG